ncbi:UDP-N-acetylmuramate--L-alanine ligase [Olivibacter sp. XZL3]|uniref:UDP-N-acetylmuramate--L-alanine ligase n=1 Tax=Olivibacter sp. XZL3 TaxID=1735116 RepID=UPI001064FBF1|nr:UDP-N-acetylmuramate--L-alanine ligase [Olivibacter sp. XZL3]
MVLTNVKQVFLIGIGGIGMSALARYFHHKGMRVSGYDKTETSLTRQLCSEGMAVFYTDKTELIPAGFAEDPSSSLVIYTPAVPADLNILTFFKALGYRLFKRSEVLGKISEAHFTIAVAGTHGKTTTSSMIAHILTSCSRPCSAFLGGIAANYDTNLLLADTDLLVVEADEFDRSFLTLHPDIAIVTATDADHLDIYGNAEQVLESFQLFIGQVSPNGKRIVKAGLKLLADIRYAVEVPVDAYATDVQIRDRSFYFDYVGRHSTISDIKMGIAGKHNIENAVAAITAAKLLGIDDLLIKTALASFKGVKRRFEYIVNSNDVVYVDDYAHHPEELKACLSAMKELYGEKEITCIFQPHLFTRTRDFINDFAEVLGMADVLILMDIYPAREQPITGVTSDWLLSKVALKKKYKLSAEEILAYVKKERPEVLLTVGAGNIDLLVNPIKERLTNVGSR